MRPSILLRFKQGLIYSAMLSTLILAGCQLSGQQGSAPISSATSGQGDNAISHYQSIIDKSNNKPSIDVLRAYIAQEPLLSDSVARQKNIDGLWQMLTQMSPEQIQGVGADENILQGWVDLLDIYQNNRDDTDSLKAGYDDWKMRYPLNPAAKTPPTQLQQAILPAVGATPRIALLLPLSGQGKVFAEAIMQGFLDAQKGLPSAPTNNVATLPTTSSTTAAENANDQDDILDQIYAEVTAPEDTNTSAATTIANLQIDPVPQNSQSVKVYDTTSQPIEQLLQQAQADGYNLVVGPLLKSNVQKIAQMGSPISVLALNELDADQLQPRPNLCYFSLSPEDEARNAAQHIAQQGKSAPLVLVPANAFGERIAKAFADEWQIKNGSTVLKQSFGSVASLKESINRGTGIRMTGTPVIINTPAPQPLNAESYPALETESPSNVASDRIDAVYIVATRDELVLIKPMIEMAISTRSRPDLYASSRSNQAGSGADFRFEMEGVEFSEIPLLAGANANLMKQAQQKLAQDYSLLRLYAMGVDAWSLSNNYNQLQNNSQFKINGASGKLDVTDNCVIYRELPWLEFSKGQIKAVN